MQCCNNDRRRWNPDAIPIWVSHRAQAATWHGSQCSVLDTKRLSDLIFPVINIFYTQVTPPYTYLLPLAWMYNKFISLHSLDTEGGVVSGMNKEYEESVGTILSDVKPVSLVTRCETREERRSYDGCQDNERVSPNQRPVLRHLTNERASLDKDRVIV